jgi:cytoskeleton protein RodZ
MNPTEPPLNDTPASAPSGPGALLRQAREAQGLHIAALAAAIKVSPRKLDALEGDRWHELPDATFTRALARTVCRTLRIDPAPVLAGLPSAPHDAVQAARLDIGPGLGGAGGSGGAAPRRPVPLLVWLGLALLAGALALLLAPAPWWPGWGSGGAPGGCGGAPGWQRQWAADRRPGLAKRSWQGVRGG